LKVDLRAQLDAASGSSWALRKLNWMLWLGIRFNYPHRIAIHKVEEERITTRIDKRKINTNHIGGIHACGLATAAEFCSGLVLLRGLDPRKYRLIMQKLTVEYHYQARKDALASFSLSKDVLKREIIEVLEKEGAVFYTCEIPVHDVDGNHLCTAYTTWQIKSWEKVRTK